MGAFMMHVIHNQWYKHLLTGYSSVMSTLISFDKMFAYCCIEMLSSELIVFQLCFMLFALIN
jgi:hypothetical protein